MGMPDYIDLNDFPDDIPGGRSSPYPKMILDIINKLGNQEFTSTQIKKIVDTFPEFSNLSRHPRSNAIIWDNLGVMCREKGLIELVEKQRRGRLTVNIYRRK